MGDIKLKAEPSNTDDSEWHILLTKDRKTICRTRCIDPPLNIPKVWSITSIGRRTDFIGLPKCTLLPAPENPTEAKEWGLFLGFLQKYKKVAISKVDSFELFILPPKEGSVLSSVTVAYRKEESSPNFSNNKRNSGSDVKEVIGDAKAFILQETAVSNSNVVEDRISPCYNKFSEANSPLQKNCNLSPLQKNYVQAHPTYLKTLGQAHSGWIFGAIAELIDNSRDAKATKLEISIETIFSNIVDKNIPMISIIDDGNGMTHQEILRMISFGHKQPETSVPERIGRFGIGFKTGAMRLGKDALVLTQTAKSRSIAFLSRTLNEGGDNLEIPVVSYRRTGQHMELDTSVQDLASAKYNLKQIKKYSPFDKYFIGQKTARFKGENTGTQIYIWNLDEWGSDYCLEWESGQSNGSSFHHGDIIIRSRRVRTRPGQMSQLVPLDYSLRSYLEVIFFDPRMKIYVQQAPVKSRPLAKSLNKTVAKKGVVMGKPVHLTLGRCQIEWERANCGIFIYWHGRLIEAYKRVGSMIHNGDKGRGIIGVIDVTELMNCGDGDVWVHSNKQGFQDCEAYAELEKWLGKITDEYLDRYVDKIPVEKGNSLCKPDNEWVQCDKCRKWRRLSSGYNGEILPAEWFCYMKPFNGKCDSPEEKVKDGVITVSEKRCGYSYKEREDTSDTEETRGKGSKNDGSSSSQRKSDDSDGYRHTRNLRWSGNKRRRRGPPRSCKDT